MQAAVGPALNFPQLKVSAMNASSSDALTFSQICGYTNTERFYQCAFTVKNVHCTQYPDPIYALLTGKQDRLERLRRQKTKSELFKTVSHGLQPAGSLLHLPFLLCWMEKNVLPNISQVCRTMGPNNLFHCIS